MAWYAVYETLSGKLISIGSDDNIAITVGLDQSSVLLVGGQPDLSQVMWDTTLHLFVNRPAKILIDRLDDIQNHADYADFMTAFNSLNATNRQRIRNGVIWLLKNYRFRNQNEGVRLE